MHASSMWAHVKEEIKVRICQTFSGLHGSEEKPEAQKQLKTKICSHSSWSAHILLLFFFFCWRVHDVRLFWGQSNWPGFYMGASVRTEYEVLPSGRICARPTNPVLCVLKHTNPHLSALLHVWAYWNEHNRKHVAAMWYGPFAETYRKVTVDLSILFPACCWTLGQSCRI